MSKLVTFDELVRNILAHDPSRRCITAVAGPPASGKSSVAEAIAERLNRLQPESAAVVPMDGFHYDDMVLTARGQRPRKGAPETFDCAGFTHLLSRLAANTEAEIAIPLFDRSIEISRGSARIIPKTVQYIVTEGNYLLLNRKPWSDLQRFFDMTVFLNVNRDELRRRLLLRWQNLSPQELTLKMDGNDLPNAETVLNESFAADFTLLNDRAADIAGPDGASGAAPDC